MDKIKKIINDFLSKNVITSAEWNSVSQDVYETDKRILVRCASFGFFLFLILTVISLFIRWTVFAYPIIYGLTSFLLGFVAVCCKSLSIKKARYIILLVYAFYIILYAFSIYSGIFEYPDDFAVVYVVLEFGFPLVFIERPQRFFIVSMFAGILFCTLSVLHKNFSHYSVDIFYISTFYCISLIPSFNLAKIRIREFRLRQLIENERDTDELTGLLNKAAFFREARRAISQTKNEILVIMDLDYFKQINDTFGHFTGDHVLQMVGEAIRMFFGKNDISGRFGGDEFVILVNSSLTIESAAQKCRELLATLNKTKIFPNDNEKTPTIHASIGLCFCGDSKDIDSLFQKTDEALYNAKRAGKNSVFVLDS